MRTAAPVQRAAGGALPSSAKPHICTMLAHSATANAAKAVREVDDKMRAMIARGADVYMRRWKQYAAGLKRIS